MDRISSKFLMNNKYVQFKLIPGTYKNIIVFFDLHKLLFICKIKLDFSTIPSYLHGKGRSENLLKFIENNCNNPVLITKFILYFLNYYIDMRYIDDSKIIFSLNYNSEWQSIDVIINNNIITIYTEISVDSIFEYCDNNIITCDNI